ncbi:MAG: hypothetical protein QXD60_04670 [Nanopusillaceae archaeon]
MLTTGAGGGGAGTGAGGGGGSGVASETTGLGAGEGLGVEVEEEGGVEGGEEATGSTMSGSFNNPPISSERRLVVAVSISC